MANVYDIAGNVVFRQIVPETYGAIGDGYHDDTQAIQAAINNNGMIIFATGKTYKTTAMIRIPKDTVLELNGATLVMTADNTLLRIFANFLDSDTSFTQYNGNGNITIRNGTIIGGNISFAHGENITLENVHFKNSLSPHFLEICACKNYVINNCTFEGVINTTLSVHEYINIDPATRNAFPLLPAGSPFFDGSKNDGISVRNCYFGLGSGDYAYGFNALGVHGVAGTGRNQNITLIGNVLKGFTGCGFRINDMDKVYIAGNNIQVVGDGIRVGDVGRCNDVTIIDNYIASEEGERIALTAGQYTDITIAGNVSKGTNDLT